MAEAVSPQRVLIVDDDEVSRRVTALMFQARGWSVEAAQDLRSAIDIAMRKQPQVIVTELLLPDVQGFHFVRALRSAVDHDVQVVALSRAAVDTFERARREGFDLAFAKPLDIDEIDRHVRKTTAHARDSTRSRIEIGVRSAMTERHDDRRQHRRVSVCTTATVLARHNAAVTLTIESVSLGGARLAGEISLATGDQVQLLFEINGRPLEVRGEVVRTETVDITTDRIAVRFVDVPDDAKDAIRDLAAQMLDVAESE